MTTQTSDDTRVMPGTLQQLLDARAPAAVPAPRTRAAAGKHTRAAVAPPAPPRRRPLTPPIGSAGFWAHMAAFALTATLLGAGAGIASWDMPTTAADVPAATPSEVELTPAPPPDPVATPDPVTGDTPAPRRYRPAEAPVQTPSEAAAPGTGTAAPDPGVEPSPGGEQGPGDVEGPAEPDPGPDNPATRDGTPPAEIPDPPAKITPTPVASPSQ